MRNNNIKIERKTISNPFQINPCAQLKLSPEEYEITKGGQSNKYNRNSFQSNYNYFAQRINALDSAAKQKQMYEANKNIHIRYKSLGNSRATVKSGLSSQNKNKLSNCQSSPYLLQFNLKQSKTLQQIQKVTQRNDQRLKRQSNWNLCDTNQQVFPKHSLKLSMKNINKNYINNNEYSQNNDKNLLMKQSQVSTINQTNNTESQSLKLMQQKMAKQQLTSYFKTIFQTSINQLKAQIGLQNITILTLKQKISTLNLKIQQKQNIISYLIANKCKQKGQNSKNFLYPKGDCNIKELQTKIINLDKINQQTRLKIKNQSQFQKRLNTKIDKVIKYLLENQKKNKNIDRNIIKQQVISLKASISKFQGILQQTLKQANKSSKKCYQIKNISNNIYKQCQRIKNTLFCPINNETIMQQTAEFNNEASIYTNGNSYSQQRYANCQQKKLIQRKNSQQLNESSSYFFHPCQLGNIQKITELFINRNGQPIQCYVDNFNQVKYKDTNTYMFNKRGDIVQLNEAEKKYYIDKGFIVNNFNKL